MDMGNIAADEIDHLVTSCDPRQDRRGQTDVPNILIPEDEGRLIEQVSRVGVGFGLMTSGDLLLDPARVHVDRKWQHAPGPSTPTRLLKRTVRAARREQQPVPVAS